MYRSCIRVSTTYESRLTAPDATMNVRASCAPRSIARCVCQSTKAVPAANRNQPRYSAGMPASVHVGVPFTGILSGRQNPTTPHRLNAFALV